nr:MAG TPA: hypothetical protein [Caudoviricetes sp.]
MTTKVTKESLAEHIAVFEDENAKGYLSSHREYQLEVYRMLLALLEKEDDKR